MPANELSPLVTQLEARISKFEKQMDKAANKVGRTTRGMDKHWNSHTKRVQRRLKKFAKNAGTIIAAAGVAVAAGIAASTKSALKAADDLQHFSEQVGVSAEALQEYGFIASRMGVSTEKVNKALKVATKNIGEFITTGGKGEAAEIIKQLGIEQDIASGKLNNAGEILEVLIRRLDGVENAFERGGVASELFGRSGVEMSEILGLGSKKIDEMRQEARDLGIVLSNDLVKSGSDANDALNKLGETLSGNVRRGILEASDEIEAIAETLTTLVPKLIEWMSIMAKYTLKAAEGWGELYNRIKIVNAAVETRDFSLLSENALKTDATLMVKYSKLVEKMLALDEKIEEGGKGRASASDLGFNKLGFNRVEKLKAEREAIQEELYAIDEILEGRRPAPTMEPIPARAVSKKVTAPTFNPDTKTTKTRKPEDGLSDGFLESLEKTKQEIENARDLAISAQTPLEQFRAELKALQAVEDNPLLSAEAGGAETFARLRIAALEDLASAGGDLTVVLGELNTLASSGAVDADKARKAYADLTEETRLLNEQSKEYLQSRELENAINIAALSGNEKRLQQLTREAEIQARINELRDFGGVQNEDQARSMATAEVDGETIAAARGQFRSMFSGALREAIETGDVLGAAASLFDGVADRAFEQISNSIADTIFAALPGDMLGSIVGDSTLSAAITAAHATGGATIGASVTTGGVTAATTIGTAMTTAGAAVAAQIAAAMSTGAAASAAGSALPAFGGAFATGGTLAANRVGLVGEKGPELIMSGKTPLSIMPNEMSKRLGMGAKPMRQEVSGNRQPAQFGDVNIYGVTDVKSFRKAQGTIQSELAMASRRAGGDL